MQAARLTLKLKMPLPLQTVAPVLPQKQVVVIDKNTLQQKTNKPVKSNAQNNKAAKAQTLTDQQQEALKAKLARWKEEYKNTLALLQAKYPLCFSIPAKPLAIGIHKEIIAAENGNVSKMQIRRFFKKYCSIIDIKNY